MATDAQAIAQPAAEGEVIEQILARMRAQGGRATAARRFLLGALLELLRPHLHHAYLDAERRRRGIPHLWQAAGLQPHSRCYESLSRPGSRLISRPWIVIFTLSGLPLVVIGEVSWDFNGRG